MANINETIEGEKTSQLSQVSLDSARANHYESVFSIQGSSNRLDAAEIAGVSDIAPEFSPDSSYNKNDFRYHEGILYRAKSDMAAGPWDSSKWERSNVVNALNASLGNIETLLAAI